MKKSILILVCAVCTSMFSQISVTTITPSFSGSGGLSLDEIGNLYIGDFGDFLGMADPDGLPNDILKLDTSLNLSQYATGFVGASGNDFDSNGVLYQSDIRDNGIYKIIGGVRTFVTSTGITAPVGIVFDSNDNFFVCNCGSNTIQKVTSSGTSTTFASGSEFACPNGITIDENDNLYVVNFSNTNVVKITPSGTTSVIGNTPLGNGHLDYDPNLRNLYIASYHGQQLFYLNIDNPSIELLAGTGIRGNDDGLAMNATFSTPNGVAVSTTGDSLYVNCAVPLSGDMINPQIIRLVSGLTTLSVDENPLIAINIKTYPNPAVDKVIIEVDFLGEFDKLTFKLFDLLGRQHLEITNIETSNRMIKQVMDISSLASGPYLYSLSSDSKQLLNGKIIKR